MALSALVVLVWAFVAVALVQADDFAERCARLGGVKHGVGTTGRICLSPNGRVLLAN